MYYETFIKILYPKKEFENINNSLDGELSFYYRCNNRQYSLGDIIYIIKKSENIEFEIQIRKDETPLWYLKSILDEAKKQYIILKDNEKVIANNGRIIDVIYPEEISDDNIISQIIFILLYK